MNKLRLILKFQTCIFLCLLIGFLKGYSAPGFTENKGQIKNQYGMARTDIYYKLEAGSGLNVFLSNKGIHYQWLGAENIYRLDVQLIGANEHSRVTAEQKSGYTEQYYLDNEIALANQFGKVIYHDIYPNIDWELYINPEGKLEHDFVVKHGGKVSDIKIQYEGASNIGIDKRGALSIKTDYGNIIENPPFSYELNGGKKVKSSYRIDGTILSYQVAPYQGTIVIDPVVDWATYIGGSEYDEVWDTKIGKDGKIYVVGTTNSATNIATVGAHLTTFAGGVNAIGSDAFLMKFNLQGECLWGTYVGGSNVEIGMALAIDTGGYLYLSGRTNSTNGISTPGAHQEVKAGTSSGYDAYVVKFDTSGQRIWGTYFGGTGAEGTESISLTSDRFNNLYLVGNTQSPNMATAGSFQMTRPGNQDGFLAKFTINGNLIWSTYFGTIANDYVNAVRTDTSGNVFIAGHSLSTSGLATVGANLPTGNGGTDGFVSKFDSSGTQLWATYYGGEGFDRLNGLDVDSAGNIYFVGATESTTGIVTTTAHQQVPGGMQDICFGKFNSTGTLLWSSYYGGSDMEASPAIKYGNGKVYLTGETVSPNNISTADGINPVFNNSSSEVLLAEFNANGQRLWATYLGGDLSDGAKSLVYDPSGVLYLGGKTSSISGLATLGAHQTVFNGNKDGLLMRINMCNTPDDPTVIIGESTVCEGSEQVYRTPTVNGATVYHWMIPTGWIGTSTVDSIVVSIGSTNGDIKLVAINSCGLSDTISFFVTVNAAPQPLISRTGNILTVNQSFNSYQWYRNSQSIPGATNPSLAIITNGTYRLQVTGANSCTGMSNELEVSNSNALDDVLTAKGVMIYPNPFSGFIRFKMPFNGLVRIVDAIGKTAVEEKLSIGEQQIRVARLPAGTYMLQVFDSKGDYVGTALLSKTDY